MREKGTRELLRKLVEIRSPSGKEEKIREFLLNYLEDLGLSPKEEEGNVVVDRGDLFVGTHMDTVPQRRGYSEGAHEAFGTGVCDAKGSIASILLALNEIEDLKYSIVFFWNEEEGGDGSQAFAKTRKPKSAIVMEPTELKVATRHYGCLEVDFEAKGEEFHGAFPDLGISAIDRFIAFYQKIKNFGGRSYIRKISGGSEAYVIPGECKGVIEFVFPPEIKKEELKRRILEVSKIFDIEVSFKDDHDGFELEGKAFDILSRAIELTGGKVIKGEMPSWTDAVNLYERGWDVVVWGPGSLAKCHTPEERIKFDEIEKAKKVLVSLNSLLRYYHNYELILIYIKPFSIFIKFLIKTKMDSAKDLRQRLYFKISDLLSKLEGKMRK